MKSFGWCLATIEEKFIFPGCEKERWGQGALQMEGRLGEFRERGKTWPENNVMCPIKLHNITVFGLFLELFCDFYHPVCFKTETKTKPLTLKPTPFPLGFRSETKTKPLPIND